MLRSGRPQGNMTGKRHGTKNLVTTLIFSPSETDFVFFSASLHFDDGTTTETECKILSPWTQHWILMILNLCLLNHFAICILSALLTLATSPALSILFLPHHTGGWFPDWALQLSLVIDCKSYNMIFCQGACPGHYMNEMADIVH